MSDLRYNASGAHDPTAFAAMSNVIRAEKRQEYSGVTRGDIYYINPQTATTGSEQKPGRPAVIVSNDAANKFSGVLEVVFLTSKEKKPLPTHVKILGKTESTALCEQITSVARERLGHFVRHCTSEEMQMLDKALAVSIGLEKERI